MDFSESSHAVSVAGVDVTILGHGFLGRSIVDGLASSPHRLHVVCRAAPADALPSGVSYHVGDVGDPACLDASVRSGLTVFAVGSTFPTLSSVEFGALAAREIELLAKVLSLVARRKGHFVYLSSAAVYGEIPRGMARETDVAIPTSNYGRHKLACERRCLQIAGDLGVPVTILRLSNPFGPHQIAARRQGLIGIVIENLRSGRVTEVRGDGEDVRDYFPVALLSAVIERLAHASASPKILNISSGTGLKTRRVIELLEEWLGRPIPVRYSASVSGEIRRSVLDPTEVRRWADNMLPDASFECGLMALKRFLDQRVK